MGKYLSKVIWLVSDSVKLEFQSPDFPFSSVSTEFCYVQRKCNYPFEGVT